MTPIYPVPWVSTKSGQLHQEADVGQAVGRLGFLGPWFA